MCWGRPEQARKAGLSWPAGWSELAQHHLLRRPTGTGDRSDDALRALRRAHSRFQQVEDMTYSIAVLDTAAAALAMAGRPHDAIRLRAAVLHHARRLGVRAELLGRFRAPQLDGLMDTLLTEGDRKAAEAEGARMSWDGMVALLETNSVSIA